MINLIHWHTKANRYAVVIRHYGIRLLGWRIEVSSKPVTTNIQDGAERQGWAK